EVAGPGGRRRLPLLELYDAGGDGIRRLAIAPGEIVVAVHLPENARGRRSSYQKLRVRPAFDFPELGLAASATLDGEVVESLRIAAGGLETYPRAFDDLTRALEGERLTDERIRTLGESIAKAVRPVHNTFLPPDYRRKMTAVFVRRALDRLRRTSGAAG
ncbi:MAG TPA: hypothetical protein VGV64_04945, partial [Thermoplasmata archaeon]|nr:hypothetical protein [Thermoplasmata archaeon]